MDAEGKEIHEVASRNLAARAPRTGRPQHHNGRRALCQKPAHQAPHPGPVEGQPHTNDSAGTAGSKLTDRQHTILHPPLKKGLLHACQRRQQKRRGQRLDNRPQQRRVEEPGHRMRQRPTGGHEKDATCQIRHERGVEVTVFQRIPLNDGSGKALIDQHTQQSNVRARQRNHTEGCGR